jgi:hypothetical protein
MQTKTCPSCMEDVPTVASRCKHCFHDFHEAPPKKKNGLFGLMLLLAAMGMTGAGFIYVSNTQIVAQAETKLDSETQQIVITHISKEERKVTKVAYGDVSRVEYVLGGDDYLHEVVIVTNTGERHLIDASKGKPLAGTAEIRATQIGNARGTPCPMEKVSNIQTIGGQ